MKFGQYELQDRIAVGGMAEIYRGRASGEEGFVKSVAIKRVLPSYAQDSRFVSMLLTEARIHAQLQHRNIVQIHDLGVSEEGEYFIVLEFVDGRDLAALLECLRAPTGSPARPPRLPDAVALYIAIELGEGVHFAHELKADGQPLGLVHRDISPSNVLVSYAGEVKLSDFGLAKRRTDQSVVGSLKGKLAYMSPEQARRTPLDRRSDIFALGAVLYEMVTGQRLRDIKDEASGWQQVASGIVPPARDVRPDLPPTIDRLLARALAPDPRDRFADARAFVAEARSALELLPRTRAGEAVELAEILKRALPSGSPRPSMELSKVIRFRSEVFTAGAAGRAPAAALRLALQPKESAPPAATTAVTMVARPPERPGADAVPRVPSPAARASTPGPAAMPPAASPVEVPASPPPGRTPSGRFPSVDGPSAPSARPPATARAPSGSFAAVADSSSGPQASPLLRVPAERFPTFNDVSSTQTSPMIRPLSDRLPRFDDTSSAPTSPNMRPPAQAMRFDDTSAVPTTPSLRAPVTQLPRFDDSSSAPTSPAMRPPSGRFAAVALDSAGAAVGAGAAPAASARPSSGAIPAVSAEAAGSPGTGPARVPSGRFPTPPNAGATPLAHVHRRGVSMP